jgi:anti-anti-sigma factor
MTDTLTHLYIPRGGATYVPRPNRHPARFRLHPMMSSVAIVSAYGDIDGTNADTLTEHAFAETARYRALILDLSGLEFFGTDGFSALHRISVDCAHVGKSCGMVPSAAVERLLRICDPHGTLPTADSVGAALTSILQDLDLGLRGGVVGDPRARTA